MYTCIDLDVTKPSYWLMSTLQLLFIQIQSYLQANFSKEKYSSMNISSQILDWSSFFMKVVKL
jgi:hypothetical protein